MADQRDKPVHQRPAHHLTYTETSAQALDASDLEGYYRANVTRNPVLPSSARVKTSTYFSFLNPTTVAAPTANDQPFGNASRNSCPRAELRYVRHECA
jgi:hypothetical protein